MRMLIIALSLVAAGYTGLGFWLLYGWWDELIRHPPSDLWGLGFYALPILALDMACVALWKSTKRPVASQP